MIKHLCVFGILKTDLGLTIKNEMLHWLSQYYEVLCIEQEPPGVLFEYPAINATLKLAIQLNEPVLYIHTKGAANKNAICPFQYQMHSSINLPKNATVDDTQVVVRQMWQVEFTKNIQKYFDAVNTDKPTVACPYTGKEKITWQNAWIINPAAAKELQKTFHLDKNRYYYETMFVNTNIDVIGIVSNKCDNIAPHKELWDSIWTYLKKE